jgi:hypothetical protein
LTIEYQSTVKNQQFIRTTNEESRVLEHPAFIFSPRKRAERIQAISGYKDSMDWASPDEVAEWRNRQDEQQQSESLADDGYVSYQYRDDDGHQVSGCIRSFEPFVLDGSNDLSGVNACIVTSASSQSRSAISTSIISNR